MYKACSYEISLASKLVGLDRFGLAEGSQGLVKSPQLLVKGPPRAGLRPLRAGWKPLRPGWRLPRPDLAGGWMDMGTDKISQYLRVPESEPKPKLWLSKLTYARQKQTSVI